MSDQQPEPNEAVPYPAPEAFPPIPPVPAPEAFPPVPPPPGALAPPTWPAPEPVVGAVPPVPPYTPPAGYAPAAAFPPAPKTSSNAIVALVLAVLSWALCPLIPAIVALVFAGMASKEIAASGGQIEGQGLTTAAKIVSWVNIGLYGAAIVVGGFLLVLFAVAGATS